MTVFEILNFNKELLRRLMATGVKANDCVYVDLYNDYLQMRDTGNKMTYIVAMLSDKYNVSERQVYSIIDRLGKDCKSCAVQPGLKIMPCACFHATLYKQKTNKAWKY